MTAPTGILAEIVAAIGPEAAERLARELGGQYVWLSARPGAGSLIARTVGLSEARALAEALGGDRSLAVPCGPHRGQSGRRERIARLLAEGWPHSRIAAEVGVHVRTVERVSAARGDERQPTLFD